jgi:hypothetical protein
LEISGVEHTPVHIAGQSRNRWVLIVYTFDVYDSLQRSILQQGPLLRHKGDGCKTGNTPELIELFCGEIDCLSFFRAYPLLRIKRGIE